MKLSGTQLGILSTAFLSVYGPLSPFAGYLGDRFGWRRVILISLLVVEPGDVGDGAGTGSAMPVLCQIARQQVRSTGNGIFNCAGCIVGGLMATVAGSLRAAFGLSASVKLAAAVLLGSAMLLLRVHPGVERAASPAAPKATPER